MKKILSFALVGLIIAPACFADVNIADLKATSNEALLRLINGYDAKISSLEGEVSALRKELSKYQSGSISLPTTTTGSTSSVKTTTGSTTPATITPVPTVVTASGATIVSTGSTGNAKYDTIISKVNKEFSFILSANNLSASGSIGLFEFIEPNAFFISIDDGNNPAGVTAFKTKILYQYTTYGSLVFTTVGVFDLDYTSQKYITKYGKNPYASATRIRIKNPNYKGKLLEESTTSTSTSSTSTSTSSSSTTTSTTPSAATIANPTVADIQSAYDNKKYSSVITMANTYLKKSSNSDVLYLRGMCYYMSADYTNALKDFILLKQSQGDTMSCTNAKNGWFIAKAAGDVTSTKSFLDYYNAKKCK